MPQNYTRIQELLNNANFALRELEEEIKKEFDTPVENIPKETFKLVNIPDKYIRTAEHFRNTYKLRLLITNPHQIDNIAYSLQLSDLYNYYLSRFNLYGVIKNLFIKQAIINLFSIQEGILYSTLMSLHSFCLLEGSVCKKASLCPVYIKSRNKLNFKDLLETYETKIKFHHERMVEFLEELKEIRDYVHIEDVQFNEWAEDKRYSVESLNKAIAVLRYTNAHLVEKVEAFKINRLKECHWEQKKLVKTK